MDLATHPDRCAVSPDDGLSPLACSNVASRCGRPVGLKHAHAAGRALLAPCSARCEMLFVGGMQAGDLNLCDDGDSQGRRLGGTATRVSAAMACRCRCRCWRDAVGPRRPVGGYCATGAGAAGVEILELLFGGTHGGRVLWLPAPTAARRRRPRALAALHMLQDVRWAPAPLPQCSPCPVRTAVDCRTAKAWLGAAR